MGEGDEMSADQIRAALETQRNMEKNLTEDVRHLIDRCITSQDRIEATRDPQPNNNFGGHLP